MFWGNRTLQNIKNSPFEKEKILSMLMINFPISLVLNAILVALYGHTISIIVSTLVVLPLNLLILRVYDSKKQELLGLRKIKNSFWWKGKIKFIFLTAVSVWDAKLFIIFVRKEVDSFNGLPNWKIKFLFLLSSTVINIGLNGLIFIVSSFWNYLSKTL